MKLMEGECVDEEKYVRLKTPLRQSLVQLQNNCSLSLSLSLSLSPIVIISHFKHNQEKKYLYISESFFFDEFIYK